MHFNAWNIENEAAYIYLIEKAINAQLSNHLKDPKVFELVKAYQVHAHSRTCWKYSKNECRLSYRRYFTEGEILAKPLDCRFSSDEKQKVLAWRNTLLRQVKSYVDNNLCPAQVNVIDPTKDIFTKLLSIKEILDELKFSKDFYCRVFLEDLELHLKGILFPALSIVSVLAWKLGKQIWSFNRLLMSIRQWHMCHYFSKTGDQCS